MKKNKDRFNLENNSDLDQEFQGIIFTDDADTYSDSNESTSNADKDYSGGGKKKKKKRRKKRYLLKFIIFLLVVAAVILFLRSSFFNIEKIDVSNNVHYTKEQIIKLVGVKNGDNLFTFTAGGLKKKLMSDPYIETAEVERKLPHTLDITVKERAEKIVVPYGEKYVVADLDGMILRIADEAPDITVISELDIVKPTPGTALEAEETQILADALNLLKNVEKVDIYFKKISVSRHSVKAYIYDNLAVEGSYDYISEHLTYLPAVINDLHKKKIKRGTIKPSGNKDFSYQPEIDGDKA